jgi:ABC-type antimicrobial peptide transport system permease subunit
MDWSKDIKDIDRICFITCPDKTGIERVSYNRNIGKTLENDFPEIESNVSYIAMMPQIGKTCEIPQPDGTNKYFEEIFVIADAKFLDFFNIQFIEGSINDLIKNENGILLAEKTAMKMFGTVDVVGKTFHNADDFREDNTVYTIRGVVKDFPKRSYFENYSGINWNTVLTDAMSYGYYNIFVKIKRGADLEKLNEKLKEHLVRYNNQNENGVKAQLKPLREYYDFVSNGEHSRTAYMFFMIGFLVLLTAILNYIVFISGRVLTRIRECGIRKVNGSGRYNIFMLFFTEALTVYLAACAIGFLIVEFTFPLFKGIEIFSTLEIGYMYMLLAQYTVAGIAFIALLCLAITWRLIRIPAIQSINNEAVLRQNNVVRNIFMTVQFVICFFFISGSWFINSQNNLMASMATGGLSDDDKARIFSVHATGDKMDAARPAIHNFLVQNPNIEIISRNGMNLFGAWGIGKGYFTWDSITETEQNIKISHMFTDANFVDLLKIAPKEGRMFAQGEIDKMVVNESFAKAVNRNPVGMIIGIKMWDEEAQLQRMQYYQVVGIIPDITNNQYEFRSEPVHSCLYVPFPENYINLTYYVKVRPGYEKIFPQKMEEELKKYLVVVSKNYAVQSQNEHISSMMDKEQNLFKMTTIFSTVCVIITLLGIYAAVVLSTEKRKKEIIIRKIHGATPWIIIRMFCKNIYLLLGLSACIAFPVVVYLLRNWLTDYAVKIEIGVLPFISLFLLLAALVTAITIGQIVRIARGELRVKS